MSKFLRRITALLAAIAVLHYLMDGGIILAANAQKTNKNANIGTIYWWSYGGKVDWLADGYKTRASMFYDKKDGLLTYCANEEKSFSTDRDTAMSKTSAAAASAISGLEWLGDLDRKYRAAFILEYGYSNTASAVEQELESSDTPMWRYGVTQLLIWANAKGYWDDAAHMKKIRTNATTAMGVDASASTIGAYWDSIVASVNSALAQALKSPTNRHAGLIIYTGDSAQQEQIAYSVDFTIDTAEAYMAKASAAAGVTSGNSLYVLKGTQYGIYLTQADAAAHTNEIAKLTVAASGNTPKATLEAGRTYWYSEIKAGSGFLKDASATTPVSFSVAKGKTKKISVKDVPIASAGKVQIKKTSSGAVIKDGAAVFQVDFYGAAADDVMGQGAPAPMRTWYFETSQGVLNLRDAERLLPQFGEAACDSLFTNAEGTVVLPLGTIRVREVQAPEGYLAADQVFYGEIKVNSKKTGATFTWVSPSEGALAINKLVASLDNEEDRQPQIHTTAVSTDTDGHIGRASEEVTIKDTVQYENLVLGQTYEMHGRLVVGGSGEPYLDAAGNEVTAVSEPFTIQEGEGSGVVEMWFVFDGSNLNGMKITVFEDLFSEGEIIASHQDPDDAEQAVQFPSIQTLAHLEDSDEKTALAEEEVTIVDTVSYQNLIPGETYMLTASIKNKDEDEFIIEDGDALVRQIEFVPEEPNGTKDIAITFDASDLGETDLVIYESLTRGNVTIATHMDLDDVDQMIHIKERKTDLTILKTVEGNGGNKTEVFPFTLHMAYKGQPLEGSYTAYDEDGEALEDIVFEDGVASFMLGHDQSITIQDLPVNATYEITEDCNSYIAVINAPEGSLMPEGAFICCVNSRNEIVPTGLKPFSWRIPFGIGLTALAVLLGILKRNIMREKC